MCISGSSMILTSNVETCTRSGLVYGLIHIRVYFRFPGLTDDYYLSRPLDFCPRNPVTYAPLRRIISSNNRRPRLTRTAPHLPSRENSLSRT